MTKGETTFHVGRDVTLCPMCRLPLCMHNHCINEHCSQFARRHCIVRFAFSVKAIPQNEQEGKGSNPNAA